MGSVFGGITDAIGLTDYKGEKQAAAASAAASRHGYELSKEQIEMAKEQIAFTKEQYADWQNIYGDLQENLGEYYKSLTPEKLTTLGLENQQREFQQVDTALRREFAQKGITGSGEETAALTGVAYSNAAARAKIRASADKTVAEEKLKFLGVGLGQGSQLLAGVGDAASNVTQAYSTGIGSRTSIAQSYISQQTALSKANMEFTRDMASIGTSYLPTPGGK